MPFNNYTVVKNNGLEQYLEILENIKDTVLDLKAG